MKRGQIDAPSWNAAIDAVQSAVRELPDRYAVSEEQVGALDAVLELCEGLRSLKRSVHRPTNAELAAKYGICERTVRYWRREGCPFDQGQAHVLKWIAGRRYAPARTEAKFRRQLEKLRMKARFAGLPELLANIRHVKWLYREHGMEPEDWMRNFRAKRGKVQFPGADVYQPGETTPPTNGESTAEPHG